MNSKELLKNIANGALDSRFISLYGEEALESQKVRYSAAELRIEI